MLCYTSSVDYKALCDRRTKIIELKERGFTFDYIGRKLEVSRQRVHQIFNTPVQPPPVRLPKPPKITKYCVLCGVVTGQKFCADCRRPFEGLGGRERTRMLVRIRDKFTCQTCGRVWKDGERQFDCHHIDGNCGKKSRNYDPVDALDTMKTLCHKCHYNDPLHSMNVYRAGLGLSFL